VRVSRLRVGEHIVKSTCHVCHSAAGPNPSPQQLSEGAIPPLNALALRVNRAELVRKVTHGAPVLMGASPELFRGRMPVFYYLSEEEAADVYLYLERYPPYQWAVLSPIPASTAADQSVTDSGPRFTGASFVVATGNAGTKLTPEDTNMTDLPFFIGGVAVVLMGLGVVFTLYELKRLSAVRQDRKRAAHRISEAAVANSVARRIPTAA
jgi:mono/diheme cytochrome c family protein